MFSSLKPIPIPDKLPQNGFFTLLKSGSEAFQPCCHKNTETRSPTSAAQQGLCHSKAAQLVTVHGREHCPSELFGS